jgi:hypothetical protein
MESVLSLITYNSEKETNHKLASVLKLDKLAYVKDGIQSNYSYIDSNIRYSVIPRNPYIISKDINLSTTQVINSIDKKFIINLSRVIDRYLSILDNKTVLYYSPLSLLNYTLELLQTEKISHIIFGDWPHSPLEYSLYVLSKYLNIKTLVFRNLPHNHITGSERLTVTSCFPKLQDCDCSVIEEKTAFDHYNVNNKYINFTYSKHHLGKNKGLIDKIKDNIKINDFSILKRILIFIRYLVKVYLTNAIYFKKIVSWAESIEQQPDFSLDYIYFPLHFQPEASTIPWGNENYDQLKVLDELSNVLPDNVCIYVKEHPAYWSRKTIHDIRKFRYEEFYTSINTNKKVKFISHDFSTYELISKSLLTATITGSVAWESYEVNKSCLLFGESIYSSLPNVYSVKSISDELNPKKIIEFSKYKASEKEINRFNNCLSKYSLLFNRFELKSLDEYDTLKLKLLVNIMENN